MCVPINLYRPFVARSMPHTPPRWLLTRTQGGGGGAGGAGGGGGGTGSLRSLSLMIQHRRCNMLPCRRSPSVCVCVCGDRWLNLCALISQYTPGMQPDQSDWDHFYIRSCCFFS